jgi:hypothetical protein
VQQALEVLHAVGVLQREIASSFLNGSAEEQSVQACALAREKNARTDLVSRYAALNSGVQADAQGSPLLVLLQGSPDTALHGGRDGVRRLELAHPFLGVRLDGVHGDGPQDDGSVRGRLEHHPRLRADAHRAQHRAGDAELAFLPNLRERHICSNEGHCAGAVKQWNQPGPGPR